MKYIIFKAEFAKIPEILKYCEFVTKEKRSR